MSPQRLKPHSRQSSYRSGEPLRHPKSSAKSSFPQPAGPSFPLAEPIFLRIETRQSGL
jgi:hypothetical protein